MVFLVLRDFPQGGTVHDVDTELVNGDAGAVHDLQKLALVVFVGGQVVHSQCWTGPRRRRLPAEAHLIASRPPSSPHLAQ